MTVVHHFRRLLATRPTAPAITYYDDATGERAEVSAVTLDNWVAKTANLLVDGCGLGTGDVAALLLPPHWQHAALMLGCWSAGLAVHDGGGDAPADVAFAGPDRLAEARAPEVYGLSLAPFAPPLREVPPGIVDYATEVRAYGDHFSARVDPDAPAFVGVSHRALIERAAARAAELGLADGDRVLVAAPDAPLDWLLAPLAAGASVVLCRNADESLLAKRAEAEKVTVTL